MLDTVRDLALRASRPPLLVFAVHAILSLGFDAYTRWPSLDVPMHLLGGIAIAAFFTRSLDVLEDRSLLDRSRGPLRALLVVGLTGLAAIGWELTEFAADALVDAG